MSLVGGFKKPGPNAFNTTGAAVNPMMRPDCPVCSKGSSYNMQQSMGHTQQSHGYGPTALGHEQRVGNPYSNMQQSGYNVGSGGTNSPFAPSGSPFGGNNGQFAQQNGQYGMPSHCICPQSHQHP